MLSKIIVLIQVILVAQTITVPPIWPKQNADILHTSNIPLPTQYANVQPKINPLQNHNIQPSQQVNSFRATHNNYQSHLPILPTIQSQSATPNLQYRSPINREVYIYHPELFTATNKNRPVEINKPSSYQIVNFDNQAIDVTIDRKSKLNNHPVRNLQNTRGKSNGQNVRLKNREDKKIDNFNTDNNNNYKAPIREHEFPRDVPTKPIYPGEGQWAKPQLRHKPYVDNKKQAQAPHQEKDEKIPEGYDIFEQGQEQFQRAQNKFRHDLDTFPQRHNLKSPQIDEEHNESPPLYEKPEIGFVPQKLYAQVRRTETEQHLPRSAIDPEEEENASRLREVIKDSKIHTVYTEEGYEDSSYDHAGHEKHAENSEEQSQLADDQSKSLNGHRRNGRNKYSGNGENGRRHNFERRRLRDEQGDSDGQNDEPAKYKKHRKIEPDNNSASSNTHTKIITTTTDELPTKNIMKVKMQTRNKGDIDMEIYTEVKYVPGSQKKKHKFVKIVPSYQKPGISQEHNKTESYTVTPLRRVKRYDKNELSKRYVRKRPNYYWKKTKTSTTEGPLLNMRRKFEAAFKSHNRSFRTTTTDIPLDDNSTTKSTVTTSASTITSTTATTAATIISTTPIPPPTPSIEDFQDKQKQIFTKSSKVDLPKIKIRKYVVKRQKRYTIDHPNIDIDLKEFVDIKELPDPTAKPDLTFVKYPYYKMPITDHFNEYSPLRYAEDMKTIPKKAEDLSFYESRSHIECPEIESNVDPIPDRVREQEENEETDKSDEEPDLPRLRGLGDKIDCFKIKYFGENPLDSPFFQEENIHVPIPLLAIKNVNIDNKNNVKVTSSTNSAKDIYYKTGKYDNNAEINEKISGGTKNNTDNVKLSLEKLQSNKNDLSATKITFDRAQNELSRARKRELKIKILEPIVIINEEMFQTATINPIHQKSDAVLKPPYTLLEMMDMNLKKIKLKPKSIYDQITLLEEENGERTSDKTIPLNDKFIVIYENEDVNMKNTSTEHPLENKIKMIKPAINGYKSPKVSDIISDLTIYSQGVEQPDIINLLTKNVPIASSESPHKIEEHTTPNSNENITLKPRKISIKNPAQKSNKVSNIESLRTTTLQPEITRHRSIPSRATTPLPISEILKSQMPQQEKLTQDTITEITSKPSLPVQNSYFQISRRSSLPYIFDISRFLPKIPNHKIITSEVHYKDEIKPSEQLQMYSDVLKTINNSKEMSEQSTTSNPTYVETNKQETAHTNIHENPTTQKNLQNFKYLQFSSTKSIIHDGHIADSSDKVIGLVPPTKGSPYRTVMPSSVNYIQNRQPTLEAQNAQETQCINYYYILGLKPPPQKKPFFKIYHKISKRNVIKSVNSKSKIVTDHLINNKKTDNYISFINKHHDRSKRHVNEKQDELEDLVAEESRSYDVTPSRKPKIYTEIIRTRPARVETEEDYEDLNPRKRVYELKAFNSATTENTVNFEEVIEEEIPVQTEPPTTPKPIIYPVEANSDNPNIAQYIFFVDQLHEKWEKEKPSTESVPETTSQISVPKPTEVMQTVAESINVPSGEPAFLQIINQLRNVQKEEEKKNPPITTTEASLVIEEITSSDPVKNSNPYILESVIPESFMSELNSMQAKLDPEKFNDNSNQEGSSRMRNFSAKFKTSIDTSKYKTIERNPVSFRHNLSSRYNADDQELPLSRVQTTQLPMVITSKSEEDIMKQPSEDVESKTEGTLSKAEAEIIISTTARSRQQSRSKSRPTTTATPEKLKTITVNPAHRRRRPTRITTTAPITKSPSSHTRRRSRLRPESQLRTSTSESLTKGAYTSTAETPKSETITKMVSETPEDNKKQRRLQTIHERRVVSEVTLTRFFEPNSDESGINSSNENVEETKNHDQQIIGSLTHTTEELFSDPHLAKNVNQLKDDQQSTVDSEETVNKFRTTSESSTANLYPNMARMINRLAEKQADTKIPINHDLSDEDDIENESSTEEKPLFIKDPSKRMYYYARL